MMQDTPARLIAIGDIQERLSPPGQDGDIHVVVHHPTTDGEPYFEPGRYNMDTVAVYGKTLTACDVLTKQVWQVE